MGWWWFQVTCGVGVAQASAEMYGAGKLLLKDTVLEMKANRRYGVVGHNGAAVVEVVELSSIGSLFFSNPEVAENVWVNTVEVCLGRQLLMFRGRVCIHT